MTEKPNNIAAISDGKNGASRASVREVLEDALKALDTDMPPNKIMIIGLRDYPNDPDYYLGANSNMTSAEEVVAMRFHEYDLLKEANGD